MLKEYPPEVQPGNKGYMIKDGYIMIRKPSHPDSWSNGYIKLHRLVMEKILGRRLKPDEIVHHIDFNKQNNSPENLQLVDQEEHRRIHNFQTKEYKSKGDIKQIKDLYEQGFSTRQIAAQTGISKSAVGEKIRKLGISRSYLSGAIHIANPVKQISVTDEMVKEINKLRALGFTYNQIAEKVGCSSTTVGTYVSEDLRKIKN